MQPNYEFLGKYNLGHWPNTFSDTPIVLDLKN
jgi:hypothetical protein